MRLRELFFLFVSFFACFYSDAWFCFLQQLEKESADGEKEQKERDKREEERARDDDGGDHPF